MTFNLQNIINDDISDINKPIDLYSKQEEIKELKYKCYNEILVNCRKQIYITSKKAKTNCIFQIPKIIFGKGYPLVNYHECSSYIIDNLQKIDSNINVKFYDPNILLITWG
jgi:hypothetical protein